jgi:3-deoxy-D-manno-octulosonic-acid transferase
MRLIAALTIYRLLLPLLFIAAFPGWMMKMLRRGGIGTGLGERMAIYTREPEFEPCGEVHFHAVSVGESLLALKLIREWLTTEPEQRFTLATGTATGHAVAATAGIPNLRVTYSPLDFPSMVRRYLDRFEPSQIVLVEGEVWPHLLLECKARKIPVRLVNARISPRSARRFARFAAWLRPIYQLLDAVAIQEPEDAGIWETLGIDGSRIHDTGSLKFDPGSGARPGQHSKFQEMLDAFGKSRPVILAASTHAGEDAWIATAIREANPAALPVLVPRHAERRMEVKMELEKAGFRVEHRSALDRSNINRESCFVIDSTGELRDWTAHADVVIIGKSFLSEGGQNPCEAILAGKPVVFGPHMENFQPLARRLVANESCICAKDQQQLASAILSALDPSVAGKMTRNATATLSRHEGATRRILSLLQTGNAP